MNFRFAPICDVQGELFADTKQPLSKPTECPEWVADDGTRLRHRRLYAPIALGFLN